MKSFHLGSILKDFPYFFFYKEEVSCFLLSVNKIKTIFMYHSLCIL
jgi:hypothetical protein